jgi:hypothetical protein
MKTRNLMFIFLGVILALGCLTMLSPKKALLLFSERNELEYIMPTLARYRAEFSLKDKEFTHIYINPFPDKKEETKDKDKKADLKKQVAKKPRGVVPKLNKASEDEKKEESQNNQNDENQVGAVADSREIPQTGGAGQKNSFIAGPSPIDGRNLVTNWKNRLLVNPTKEIMNEFLQQYLLGKITKEVFYGIMADLIEDHNPKVQDIALYGLAATPSFESFSQLAVAADMLSGSEKSHAQKYLMAYTNRDLLPILEIAMKDQNQIVIAAATLVLINAIKTIKSTLITKNPQDQGRFARGEPEYISQTEGGANPVNRYKNNMELNFNKFIPILRELQLNSNSNISSNAQSALSQLSNFASN